MNELINNVESFNWQNYAAKLSVGITYGFVVGTIGSALLDGLSLSVLALSGSATLSLLTYIVGMAAIIYFTLVTADHVANYLVDKLPGDTRGAFNAAKAWFNKSGGARDTLTSTYDVVRNKFVTQ